MAPLERVVGIINSTNTDAVACDQFGTRVAVNRLRQVFHQEQVEVAAVGDHHHHQFMADLQAWLVDAAPADLDSDVSEASVEGVMEG